jgi:pilus assembly protein FimV
VAASKPTVVASAPAPVASAPAPTAAASAPAARVASAPAATDEQPGLLASLMEDNPLVLPGAGVLALLLGGLGLYRLRGKMRKDASETSFLESRLQPDSFFGASGGQRVDTRDAGGASSSMSYSLSQLDAIGDVDPVAEADVYLAYGRDLQAEEILKEAMRSNPERMAIRSKLLEVYAKRRDTKGYELLATQLYSLVKGEGEDWGKAQEMGRQIDPENPLYQPGGKPANVVVQDGGRIVEPLGASTMPQSVMPSTSSFAPSDPMEQGVGVDLEGELGDSTSGVDLDLDLGSGLTEPLAPPPLPEVTKPMPADMSNDDGMDFDLGTPAAPAAAKLPAAPGAGGMDFDLGSISLDLEPPAAGSPASRPAPLAADPALDFSDFTLPGNTAPASIDESDPLARKLELAEEFRQIGDIEGARDLLEEVLSKASGSLKTKAQGMLDSLT